MSTDSELEQCIAEWLLDCEYRQHSAATLATRKLVSGKLVWFLHHRSFAICGAAELREFFGYLRRGHEQGESRWGNVKNPKCSAPLRPCTVRMYFNHLKPLFGWMVTESIIPCSPMDKLAPPIERQDQIQPFTEEQIGQLLQAARRSRHRQRDTAIVLVLLDTGMRASELCGLKTGDVDLEGRVFRVVGKGNKRRFCPYSVTTAKALASYFRKHPRQSDEPLFDSDRGVGGKRFSRSGLFQLIQRLGESAGISGVRCSPHTLRHISAIFWLRNGGDVFTLKLMMGHNSLATTQKYLAVAQADVATKHRTCSPVDRLKKLRA